MSVDYQMVIRDSRQELREQVKEREKLDRRINELRTALRALAKFIPEGERQQVMEEVKNAKRKGASLTEAIMDVLSQPENANGLSGNEIHENLEESGFDLDDYSQPLAAVQTTMQRLCEQGRAKRSLTRDSKGGVVYKSAVPGLKSAAKPKPPIYG